jgi:hypothetical protein
MNKTPSREKIDEVLTKWNEIKKQKQRLEEEEEDIKYVIKDLLYELNKSSLSGRKYTVEQKIQTRKTISRKDLPPEIFDKYYKESSTKVLYLKKNK